MTAATTPMPQEADESGREEPAASNPCVTAPAHKPLPGVMDFIGAHVGGELAEERWR